MYMIYDTVMYVIWADLWYDMIWYEVISFAKIWHGIAYDMVWYEI